jgi:hypothetical protein
VSGEWSLFCPLSSVLCPLALFTQTLVEFLFRLTFGVAAAMGVTSSRQVTSGFFRVHLWVLMGVQTLAALATYTWPLNGKTPAAAIGLWQFAAAVTAAIASYVGAVVWMYERRALGKTLIWLVSVLALSSCMVPLLLGKPGMSILQVTDRVTSGALLGLVTTAMLLGHWYLNTPTMQLAPLQRLIVLLAAAVLLRMIVCGSGAAMELAVAGRMQLPGLTSWLLFVSLRWLAGLFGVLGLAWLTWQTLKIPNTQSATGILYAAVILAFIGELASQLLSAEAAYPI